MSPAVMFRWCVVGCLVLAVGLLPSSAQEPTLSTSRDASAETPAIDKAARPSWSVVGRVVDVEGQPIAGAAIRVFTGMGSLRRSGQGETDDQGKFDVSFGPGISIASGGGSQLQIASVYVSKPGYFEKNLGRQGNLMMAKHLPDDFRPSGSFTAEDVILPGKPRELEFCLLPAAHLHGSVVDEMERPLAGYTVSLRGESLPVSSSTAGSAKTDENGAFRIEEIPVGFEYQILVSPVDPKPPWNGWASGPFRFAIPKRADSAVALSDGKTDFEADRIQIQLKSRGINWKRAIAVGADHQTVERSDDTLHLVLHPPGTSQSKPEHADQISIELGELHQSGDSSNTWSFASRFRGDVRLVSPNDLLEIPSDVALPSAIPLNVRTRLRSDLRVTVTLQLRAPQDPAGRLLVDLQGLDSDRQSVFHDWRLLSSPSVKPDENRLNTTENPVSVRIEIPRSRLVELRLIRLGIRELSPQEADRYPERASRTNLRRSAGADRGEWIIRFDNPWNAYQPGNIALDPDHNQVIFQVVARDDSGKIVRKTFRQLAARRDGGYEQKIRVDPALVSRSRVSVTFVTIQPEHDKWVDDFFIKGVGTAYKGLWIGDAAELTKVKIETLED